MNIRVAHEVARIKLRAQKCAAVRSSNPNDPDVACGYETTITCDDCKYGAGGGRKDPQAKCNQPKEQP
jgi:hypothetical protein